MVKTLKSEIKPEVYQQQKAGKHFLNLLREEYETWELVTQILSAEKKWFERGDIPAKMCPKSREQQNVLQDHECAVVHAITRWLEKIYERKDVTTQDSIAQVFEFLRQGDVKAAQKHLLEKNAIEFLWLLGGQPHFDNVEFSLLGDTTEDLLPLDIVEEANMKELFNQV